MRKGIIMAGGENTRLYPTTLAVSKQLLPVYDKPMIYYPLATLMQAGIRDILLIVKPRDLDTFQGLLGDGSQLGLSISYATQEVALGIADAFRIGKSFIDQQSVAFILGDNLFHGHGLTDLMVKADQRESGATIFATQVADPERYGVVQFDTDGNALSLTEKPPVPVSDWAVTGLYFYDSEVVSIAESLVPSARGEIEITDVNIHYLNSNQLRVERLDEGFLWLDTGTPDALAQATAIVQGIEQRQNSRIACLEQIAYERGWIDLDQVHLRATALGSSAYGRHLANLG
jgi:glucose-1-phosphate thymidylyltransferase